MHECFLTLDKQSVAIDLMPDKSWRGMRPGPVTALCISYAFPDCIRTLCKLFPLLQSATYVDFFLLALFWTTPTFIQMRLIAGIRKRCHFETAIKMNAQVVCITKPSPVAAPCGSCAIVYQFLSSAQQFADRPWKYVHVLTILGYSFLRG